MAKRYGRLMPLHEAAWRFATSAMRADAIKERLEPRAKVTIRNFDDDRVQRTAQAISAVSEHVLDFIDHVRDPRAPRPEMMRRLIRLLNEGSFEAFGVRTKPELGHTPERLPEFIFESRPKISWAKSTIENFGHKFEAVKVRRSIAASPHMRTTNVILRGRPTKNQEINKAIDGLIANGIDLGKMERRRARAEIKKFAKRELGANIEIGYSDPVLQRHLQGRFGKRS